MGNSVTVEIGKLGGKVGGTAVVFAGEGLALGPAAETMVPGLKALVAKAAAIENFKAKAGSALVLTAPLGLGLDKLIVVGLGGKGDKRNYVNLGGAALGHLSSAKAAAVILSMPGKPASGGDAASLGLGMGLRAYSFDRYKTKKKPDDNGGKSVAVTIHCAETAAAKAAYAKAAAIRDGVNLARDLVNEPPNVLNPAEFANRAKKLKELGVEVEVLNEAALAKLGMRMLLAVGHGSENESHVVVMRWNGAKAKKAVPVAIIGKGVTFDTGGISIKPAQGMEDMKGDMAGAACVVGLMHALAARKAKVNAIGVIGLVENMPDGKAQRPGDIVTSLSGQTVEIINTDAEGRLVLGDLLWHVQDKYKPQFMVNLATLTGAILVALGSEHAGLFSNNDRLSERLFKAGMATGEKVWRMPLNAEYDKLMDSKVADMKNSGGRMAGSISAAQFLQRYVNDCPWAHLDIAGTAMGSPQTDINKSWSSGWGVRLLDQLIAEHYEG